MAYNELLAVKIESIVMDIPGITIQKMFSGLCFMNKVHMCLGIVDQKLMVRVGKEDYVKMLKIKYVIYMDFSGRPLTGLIYVLPERIKRITSVKKWITIGLKYTS